MALELTKLERAVMDALLDGDHPVLGILRQQYAEAKVVSRELSGVGFFTNFTVPESVPRLKEEIGLIGGVGAEVEGINHGAGFWLFLKDGHINMLEGFTYDDPWHDPDLAEDFQLSYHNLGPVERRTQRDRATIEKSFSVNWPKVN
ncbi:MAG: hypothetical protein HUU29_12065 [Planctomycetaceae bacterium]|nr:hypothetical protein [Planctomycetaceae bacterium]